MRCFIVFDFYVFELFNCMSVDVCIVVSWVAANVLQLPEGGDFEALHCQPSRDFDRSTKLDLTTEPPLLGRCCYLLAFFLSLLSLV